jgi:DNA-binding beta-propeller fold protein YncE
MKECNPNRWSRRLPFPNPFAPEDVHQSQTLSCTVPLPSSLTTGTFSSGSVMASNGNVAVIPIKLQDNHWVISALYRNRGELKWAVYEHPIPEIKGVAITSVDKKPQGWKSKIIPVVLGIFLVIEIAFLSAGIGLLVKYGGHVPEPRTYVRDTTYSSYLKFGVPQLEALPFDKYGWYLFAIQDHPGMVDVIPVAYGPVASAVVSESQIYVVSGISKAVSVVDIHQNKVIWTILLTSIPSYVAISPDEKYAWVLSPYNNITVIEVATRTVVALRSLGSNVELKKIIFSFDGGMAWVVGGNLTSVIDTATYEVQKKPIEVGEQSEDIALTFDGTRALVPSKADNLIAVINAKEQVIHSFITAGIGNEPRFILTSHHKWAFIANFASGTVSVIDTDSVDELYICANITIPRPSQPMQLIMAPDGNRIYGINRLNSIFVIKVAAENLDCSENKLIATISVPTTPYAIAITSDGSRIVVSHESGPGSGGGITIVDTANIEDKEMKRTKTVWITGSELGEPILINQ